MHLNQKIEVQKHFFSTKRKTQKRNVRLEKPTKEQKMEMIENWKNKTDVLDTDKTSLIPGEAVEANLADLKRFITDGAWKAVCKLG